jgi:hypothetical protein
VGLGPAFRILSRALLLAALLTAAAAAAECPSRQGDRRVVWCWKGDGLAVVVGKQMPILSPQDLDEMRPIFRPGRCLKPFKRMAETSTEWRWYFCGIDSDARLVDVPGMPVLLLQNGDRVTAREWLVPLDEGMCVVLEMPMPFDRTVIQRRDREDTRCVGFAAFPYRTDSGRKWDEQDVVGVALAPARPAAP